MELKVIFLLFVTVVLTTDNVTVYANPREDPQSLEEIFPPIEYTTVEAVLENFEEHFKQKMKLPLRVPPISFTHHFERN